MKRTILLVDSGCGACSELGRRIRYEGQPDLEIGSLHDPRYAEHIGEFEPTLLRFDGPAVTVSTGARLAAGLVRTVGVRRAFRIAQLVREATQAPGFDASRRSFLIKAAGAAAVLPLAGVLGVKSVSAADEGTLTRAQARAAYDLLLASAKYRAAHKEAAADGLRHTRSRRLQAQDGAFVGSSVGIFPDGGQVVLLLTYVDSEGEGDDAHWMQAVVNPTTNTVLAALHIDVTDIVLPVTIPASSVTAGLANVRGVVHNTIEARATFNVARNSVDVPVELVRIVPGANLVEVDEDADLATTTHGLAGLEITITQRDGENVHTVTGSIGAANLALITDSALDSLVAGRETTVHIGPRVRSPAGPPVAGTVRFKGDDVDVAITDGEWSGTPAPPVGGASETLYCWAVKSQWCRYCPLVVIPKLVVACAVVCFITWLTYCIVVNVE